MSNVFSMSTARGHAVIVSKEDAMSTMQGLTEATKIEFVAKNPKRSSSMAHARYAKYSTARTVAEYLAHGGNAADFEYDLRRGFVKIK